MTMSMALSRRTLLGAAVSGLPAMGARSRLRIGVTDWNLRLGANPEAARLAAAIGFEGVEVSFGRPRPGDLRLPLDRPEAISAYREALASHGISIAGTCADALHTDCMMNGGKAVKWVADSVRLTRDLGGKVLLLPFFGDCEIVAPRQIKTTIAALREVAPLAERAGVTLGLENSLSAADTLTIVDGVSSPSLKVYYDPQNAIRWGHDPFKEIPALGPSRICQIHIKENAGYLGEGPVPWERLMKVIMDLGFTGWANLETTSPSKDIAADMPRNLDYVRRQIGASS
jgi:sugar phosphate isomerase/epimerase